MKRLTLTRACIALGLATLASAAGTAEAATVPARIVLRVGDTPTGDAAVTTIGPPFVNAAGEVTFSGELDDGDNYVFVGNDVVWLGSNDAVVSLTAPEAWVDSNGAGNFVYSPDADGDDAIYTDQGLLAAAGQPAVGHPAPAVYGFHIAPSMTADGTVRWISGIDLDADGDVDGRTAYVSTDGTPATITALFSSGDILGGLTLDTTPGSIDNDYAVSEDGEHSIQLVETDGANDTDQWAYVDDTLVFREGDATGFGTGWENFDLVTINNQGEYLVSGDDDGPFGTDEMLSYFGDVAVREGDVVDGVTLGAPATLRFISITDLRQAVYAWGYQGPTGFRETVFFACDATNLADAQAIVTTVDDGLDVDEDGGTDYGLGDLAFGTPTASRAMGETQFVYVPLQLEDGNTVQVAMIELPVTCCGNGVVNPFETCDDANDDDTDACISTCVDASCGDGFVWLDMEECDDGNADDTDACPTTCVPASCGDGFVRDGVEDCDDGNADDTDACTSTCVAAACGDGFVQEGVEDCDDGDDDDTDECTSTCVAAACGDGFVQEGVEDCDDGNVEDDEVCLADCTLPGGGSTGGSDTGTSPDTSAGSVSDSVTDSASGTDGDTDASEGGIEGSVGPIDTSGDETGAATDDDGGCGCTSDAPSDGRRVLLGLALLGLARRRRRT
jgi:MYXO-CTERM domain-containing protein